jgi:hypothetical protein
MDVAYSEKMGNIGQGTAYVSQISQESCGVAMWLVEDRWLLFVVGNLRKRRRQQQKKPLGCRSRPLTK